MTDLNVTVHGRPTAPAMVLVHGWGMNSAVWQPLLSFLSNDFQLHCVDLPGHGQSEFVEGGLEDWVSALDVALPESFHYLGWSLGGLLGLALKKVTKQRMLSFTMIASSPKFVESSNASNAHNFSEQDCLYQDVHPNWPAMSMKTLGQFAEGLETDLSGTLKTFLALQFYKTPTPLKNLRALQRAVLSQGNALPQALKTGLDILQTVDARDVFCELEGATVMMGAKDTLVPVGLKECMKSLNPSVEIFVNEQAGHAPFVSHPEWVAKILLEKHKSLEMYK